MVINTSTLDYTAGALEAFSNNTTIHVEVCFYVIGPHCNNLSFVGGNIHEKAARLARKKQLAPEVQTSELKFADLLDLICTTTNDAETLHSQLT